MAPRREPLRFYGAPTAVDELDWPWVREQLAVAGTYWVLARGDGHPHPRPVWGVLDDADHLHPSLGTPLLNRQLDDDPLVTVHLDSGTDVVIVEGRARRATRDESAALLDAYDAKYDWRYDLDTYGAFRTVEPEAVLAWRSAGWAGRDSFQQAGRWVFE